jgi:hypothetical protein
MRSLGNGEAAMQRESSPQSVKAVIIVRWTRVFVIASVLAAALLRTAAPEPARADEGGVSFWLPGEFGSLAAAPQVPGWAVGIINLYESEQASGAVAAAREITINKGTVPVNLSLNLNLSARADLVLVVPTYVFATKVLGGQLAVSMAGAPGYTSADLNGTLTASVGGITATRQGEISDARFGNSDLYPQVSLRWNNGVNSWMVYGMGDIPVGTYDSSRLANFGIGHGAADGGVGYTYFDQKTGHEFSVVTGLTYNLVNPSTGYQNGIDWHLDWAASQFVTKQVQVGLVGYFYDQLTADTGCAPILCPFESRTAGIGPQFGYLFPAGDMQGYLNLKGYWDYDTENRVSGYTVWLTLAFSPKAPEAPKSERPLMRK